MPYQITLPDGSIGMIDDSVPKNRAMEAAEAAYPDAFPGIGEQLLGAPGELAKGFARGFVDPVSGLLSTGYTGLRAAGMELDPFAETAVGKGLAGVQEYLAPDYGTVSQFAGALGGLGSFLVPGAALAKGLGRTATLGGMATGLGAEEARSRVEQARAEGIEVTPGQEFGVQLGGGVIGISELAPIERLTGPLQAVLRGVKKSDADMIAPGLFNSAKRMVETGGIEGLQEGMANVAQDLLAKGVYNPNLDVGESALGDAAMGASVGAFAQGAIELVTKGRRRQLYDTLKAEEDAKARIAEAEKARLAEETARKQTLTNFGVEGQPLLLAAPQGQVTPSRQEKSSLDQYGVEDKDLFEPYGTFTRDELDKDVVKELDKRRKEAGRPKTETFTLQDIADTGVYRGELNRLIAQRSGYTGELKFKPSEVVGLAEQKNIDTSTQGFSDFVARVTGKKPLPEQTGINALRGLNDVEIFAVREAINKLPTYEQRKILPTGKAAKIFDDKQSTKTLTSIKKTLGEDLGAEGLGETSILQEIGDYSGLEDVNDQKSLLEKYILDGELERVSTPAFAVLDADGKQISVVGPDARGRLTDIERRKAQEKAAKTLKPGFAVLDAKGKQVDVDVDQGKAQQKAARIGGTIQETTISGSVKDTTINQIRTPDPINRLIGGFDIRQGTFEDTLIDGYDITTETGEVISKTKSLTDAENRVNRATELRKQRQLQLLDAKQKIQENIAKSEQAMADLEALGKKDSEDFKKIQNSMAAQERNLAKVEQNLIEFGKKVAFKSRYKQQKRTGFTLFEGNKPVGTYNSRQEALEASVVSQPTDRLEAMLEAFPTLSASAKPGMDRADIKKLQQVAANELAARKGEVPSGVGVTVEGDITAAEERLALQGIFSPRIKERVNELDKKLRAALDKLGLKDVRLNIVGAIKGELGDADGVYAARLIKIALDAENPMRVLRHEGIHALKELGAFTPDQWRVLENKAKSEWMAKYNIADPKRYGSLSPEIQLEEAIAEAFADFSQTKPPAGLIGNVFSRIKSFFTALDNGFKGLGFQTADDVFGRVERGELLPGMGERAAEVEGLQAQRVTAETPERYSLKRVAPSKVVSSVIEDLGLSDAEVAATSLGLQTGKGGTDAFKQANIGGIKQIIEYLEKRYADSGLAPLDITNEQDRDTLSKLLAAEVLAAVRSGGANIQWYDKVIDQMLGMASLKYPELRTDPNAQAAFRIAISVSSQGQNVEDNLKFGERVYEQFSQNAERGRPRFPEIGTGEAMQAMQKNFQLANKMIDKLGMDDFRKFLETPFTVKELNSVGLKIGGELVDEQVLGSSILGPKIGFGFYSNLSGNFEPVTMDMWFMRTIGRLIGKLRGFDPAKYAKQVQRFRGSFALSDESGVNGIYANEFSQEEINNAIVDEQAMIDLARKVKSKHERDFSKNRDLYDSKQRAKTDFVKSAETIIQSLDKPKDVPASGGERRLLRDVVRRMRQKVADVTGQDIPPASLQAIVWYPEQELYKALGAKLRVTSQNYANSMRKLLEGEGFDGDRISESAKLGSRRTRRADAGEIPAGTRPTGRRPSRTLSAKEREDLLKQRFSLREPAKVIYEVAPDPNNVELTERWNALPTEQKTEISKRVGARIVEAALPILKARGRVADQVGSYLDFTNPSFALVLEDGDPIEMSKLLGFALSQDSMMVVSGDSAPGLEQTGGIVINIGDLSFDQVDAIYQQLREIEVNGQKPVGGQTTVDGKMIVLNYSGLPSSDLAQLIDQQLNGQFRVGVGDFFTAFPEKGDYDYASVSNDPTGSAGLIRKRSRDLRTEASRLLNDEINAVPRDGKYSLRGTNTPEFREWFGRSQIIDEQGRPRVMYHGTARDITEFKAKQAGAIFVTDDPRFAEDFSYMSEMWMIDHADQFLSEQEIKKAVAAGVAKMAQGMPKQDQIRMLTQILQFPIDSVVRDPDATEIRNEIAKRLPSKPNILPVYVRAERPFDFENQEHLDDLRSMPGVAVHYQRIRRGEWSSIEEPEVQEAIRDLGFDGFYVKEGGKKNLAVYRPDQLKSVTGNIGTYGQREPTINEAKQFGLTIEEAKAAQKRGDIRYSLRNTNTPEFKQWFRKSPVVNAVGKPQMMFHGTSLDIEEFIPGQTGAIYVSPDPEFAGTFARYSQEREIRKLGENLDQDLEAKQRILDPIIDEAMANGDLTNRSLPYHRDLAQVGLIKDLDQYSKEYWMNWFLEKPMRDAAHSTGVGPALREALANMLTTGRNVMPLYVNPQKPFDYENNTHVNKVAKLVFEYDPDTYESANPKVQKYQRDTLINGLKAGDWRVLEEPIVQEAIKELGFDAFYVKEQDTKNLGLYKPNQLKSAIGNTGAFSPETGKVRYSLRQTNTPAFKQWFGDSKVVDKKGDPLVVYHGTDKTFDAFNLRKRGSRVGFQDDGFYFSDSPGTATTYATMDVYSGALGKKKDAYLEPTDFFKRFLSRLGLVESAPQVVPAFLSIKNPYKTTGARMPGRRELIKQGYDGIQYTQYDGTTHWVAFEPTQIKSSIGNIGTFDPENPDIRYSLRVPTTPEFKRWSRSAPFVSPDNSLSYDFKTGKPFFAGAYHGTNTESDFVAFDIEKGGLQTGAESAQLGVFSTSDPAIAENYASNLGMGRYLKLAMQGSPELKNDPTAVRLDKKISSLEKEYSSLLEGAENEARKKIEKKLTKPGATFEFGDSVLLAGTPFTKEMFVNSTLKSFDLDGIFEFAGPDYKTRATKTNEALESAKKELSRFIIDNEAAKIPQRILPLFIRMKNPMVYDAKGQTPADFPLSDKIEEAKRKGHDGVVFKNIADPSPVAVHYVTFNPDSDIKSGVGNIGIYGQREPTEAEAADFGMTKEEAKESQKRGDIRYSLRNFKLSDLPKTNTDTTVYTLPAETKIFHGSNADNSAEIKAAGHILLSTPSYKASGGSLYEGSLIWFGDEPQAQGFARSEVDRGRAAREGKAPGTVFETVTDKPMKLIHLNNFKVNEAQAQKINEYFDFPEYKRFKSGDEVGQIATRLLSHSAAARKTKTYKIGNDIFYSYSKDIADILGFDGFYHQSGIAIPAETGIRLGLTEEGGFVGKPMERFSLRQQAGQTLGQSYLDTVQRTTTPRVEKGFKDRISEAMSATPFAKFRQMFINKYERIEYYSRELAKQFGDSSLLLADQSAIAAALMSDRAAGVAAESFKSGIPVYAKGYTYVDNMGGKVKGLMEILMPLAQKQDPFVYQMFQDYAARRRGVRLDAQGKVTPFSRQELAQIPAIEKQFPEFKQVFEDYQRYNEGLVRYMRDTGVIDAKAAQEWMRYGDYIPFYRQLDGERTVGPSIFSAISGVKAPKKLKGGDAPLGEFLETVVRNSRAAIEAGMRNVAANRVVTNFQRLNSPTAGGKLVERTTEKERDFPDVVTVRENGKDAYYKVADPLLVQSLQALNIPQIPGLDILAKPAEFLREMVTRDPAFIGASVLRESLISMDHHRPKAHPRGKWC
jgi:hypothetical protein